eukprot:87497_1
MASFWISLTAFIFFVFGHHYCNTTTCTGWSTQVTYLGERSEGVVWNGSRYTFRNVIAADETERWKCHARHCNACIYLKDKEFYKYKPHEYDDADARSYEYNLHSDDEPHESWNQSALVSHDAGEFMQELVKLGVHPTKSYQQYILQNPDEVIHFKTNQCLNTNYLLLDRNRMYNRMRIGYDNILWNQSSSSQFIHHASQGYGRF